MEKIVKNGCRNCTVNLDGTETAVRFGTNYRCFAIQNDGDGDVYASIFAGASAGDDGVIRIKSGNSAVLCHMRTDIDTVYLNGVGAVQIAAGNTAENPFKNAHTGQGVGISVGEINLIGNDVDIFDIGVIEEE